MCHWLLEIQGRSSRFDQYGSGRINKYGRKINNYSPLYVAELNHSVKTGTILISVVNTRRDCIYIIIPVTVIVLEGRG